MPRKKSRRRSRSTLRRRDKSKAIVSPALPVPCPVDPLLVRRGVMTRRRCRNRYGAAGAALRIDRFRTGKFECAILPRRPQFEQPFGAHRVRNQWVSLLVADRLGGDDRTGWFPQPCSARSGPGLSVARTGTRRALPGTPESG